MSIIQIIITFSRKHTGSSFVILYSITSFKKISKHAS